MDDIIVPIIVVGMLFIGLPWLVFHYITKWKQAPRITDEDEKLLDDLYHAARRLEDRLQTVERIIAADNPDYRQIAAPTQAPTSEVPDYSYSRRN
jgi:phage shock protein B